MNSRVANNFANLKPSLFVLPIFLLALIVLVLFQKDALSVEAYSQIQKDGFFSLNSKLSHYPNLIYNITQLGDELVILSILSLLIVYSPKLWEAIVPASLFSLVFSNVLKNIFSIPRPAATFDNHSFTIIGKVLSGHSSLPSGHSVTIFTILTVLLFGFMPKDLKYKILWIPLIIFIGLCVAFTRVGVGAHFPLDVIVGSILGYISALCGIFINKKYNIWTWIGNRKYYPFFILAFFVSAIIMVNKIIGENLVVFYFALIGLVISMFKITSVYVKK